MQVESKRRLSMQLETKQSNAAELYVNELSAKQKRVSMHLSKVEVIKAASVSAKSNDVEERLAAAESRRKAIEAERLAKLAMHHSTVDEILHAQRYPQQNNNAEVPLQPLSSTRSSPLQTTDERPSKQTDSQNYPVVIHPFTESAWQQQHVPPLHLWMKKCRLRRIDELVWRSSVSLRSRRSVSMRLWCDDWRGNARVVLGLLWRIWSSWISSVKESQLSYYI